MSAHHTPGPWIAETFEGPNGPQEGIYAMIDGEHVEVCDIAHANNGGDVANARLIAAAPALLAALENLIETAPIDIECGDSVEKYRSFVLRVACAVVAAVQGGAK
jgi:hypothetical protein